MGNVCDNSNCGTPGNFLGYYTANLLSAQGAGLVLIATDANGNVWVPNFFDGSVSEFSGATGNAIGTYAVGGTQETSEMSNGPYSYVPLGVSTGCYSSYPKICYQSEGEFITYNAISGNGQQEGTPPYSFPGLQYANSSFAPAGAWAFWFTDDNSNSVGLFYPLNGLIVGKYAVGNLPAGVAVDGSNNVWVANWGSDTVTELSSSGSLIGTYAVGVHPTGIAVDNNNDVWVANSGSNTIMKLSSSGSVLATYATGVTPMGVAVGNGTNANVWFANRGSNTVTQMAENGMVIGTYQVGATYPSGIAANSSGVWVAGANGITSGDFGTVNAVITELSYSGNILGQQVMKFAEVCYTCEAAQEPGAVAADGNGNVWVANERADTVTKFSSAGNLLGIYRMGSPYGPGSGLYRFDPTGGIAVDSNNDVWIANLSSNTVRELSNNGAILGNYTAFDKSSYYWGTFSAIYGVTMVVDKYDNIWIAYENHSNKYSAYVSKLSSSGTILGEYPIGGEWQSMATDSSGNIWITYISSGGDGSLEELSNTGNLIVARDVSSDIATYDPGCTGSMPSGIAIDSSNNIWVETQGGNCPGIAEYSDTGNWIRYGRNSAEGGITAGYISP